MKVLLKVSAVILILAICVILNQYVLLPCYNASAMYGSMAQKLERAESIPSQKVIVISGSAANLSFDSQYFEQLSGIPAVNLSVSAGVPLKVYMRAAELCANDGDTVIIPLEYGYYSDDFNEISEAYVDMVGVDPKLKCDEDFWNSIEFYCQSFLRSFTRIHDCALWLLRDMVQTGNTIYVADSVNEYGDFCMHKDRPSTYVSKVSFVNFRYNAELLDQIKAFIEKMENTGVTVYLTYPCVDKEAFRNSESYFAQVQQVLRSYIPEENIMGTPHDFSFDPELFFDTAYHIRYENKGVYTEKLFAAYQVCRSQSN